MKLFNTPSPFFRIVVGTLIIIVGVMMIISSAAFADLGGKVVVLAMVLGAFTSFTGAAIVTSWDEDK